MDNELQQKNIIITEVLMQDWGFKVKDEKGLVYNISELIKSGANKGKQTVAYKYISELPKNGLGLNKCFKFVTAPNNQGGESRYVRIISEPEEGEESKYVSPKFNQSQPVKIEKQETDWDKINEKKERSIKWMNALNNACLLVANEKTNKGIKELADEIYKMEAPVSLMEKAKDAGWVTTDEPPTPEDDISVDEIPFD